MNDSTNSQFQLKTGLFFFLSSLRKINGICSKKEAAGFFGGTDTPPDVADVRRMGMTLDAKEAWSGTQKLEPSRRG